MIIFYVILGSRFQNKLEKNTLVTTKKHKKKHNKSVFEGEYVPYLISSKKSKITNSEEESDIVTVEDEYVLKKLFSKAGHFLFYIYRHNFLR